MLSISEAQWLAWLTPLLWPFVRTLALFSAMPVLGTRTVPTRVRVALAAFIAWAAQPSLPEMPVVALDSAPAVLLLVQQVVIGLTLGFAVRIVFAAVEYAGELLGLQMGLNFAAFFDPITASQSTASARFFSTLVAWLFIVSDGHLLVIQALVRSFERFPVAPEPMAMLYALQPQRWATTVFETGLWIALPLVAMLLFVNLVLGVMSRVAPQMNVFSIGFPITLSVGLVGLWLTLPWMEAPFAQVLGRLLAAFG